MTRINGHLKSILGETVKIRSKLANRVLLGLMVADDKRDIHHPFTGLVPGQDVVEAMRDLGNKDRHARPHI